MYTKVIIEDLQSEKSGKETNQYQINLYKEIFLKECKSKERIPRDETVWNKSKQEKELINKLRKQNRHFKLVTLLKWN